jgi:hypothetical protein
MSQFCRGNGPVAVLVEHFERLENIEVILLLQLFLVHEQKELIKVHLRGGSKLRPAPSRRMHAQGTAGTTSPFPSSSTSFTISSSSSCVGFCPKLLKTVPARAHQPCPQWGQRVLRVFACPRSPGDELRDMCAHALPISTVVMVPAQASKRMRIRASAHRHGHDQVQRGMQRAVRRTRKAMWSQANRAGYATVTHRRHSCRRARMLPCGDRETLRECPRPQARDLCPAHTLARTP